MDADLLQSLLGAIRDAVTPKPQCDDVALPLFDPDKSQNGASSWCKSVDDLSAEFKWSSLQLAAKAGKALRGSALSWFESWEPENGRTWENFKTDITSLYPERKNLSEKLTKAVLFTSDSSDSYCEYAREKLRLLKSTRINFTENQLIELVCGSITDFNVKTASLNGNATTTSELIASLSSWSKNPRKRQIEQNRAVFNSNDVPGPSDIKRIKSDRINDNRHGDREKRCHNCNKLGHLQAQCFANKNKSSENKNISNDQRVTASLNTPHSLNKPVCAYCKKLGHQIENCWHKQYYDTKKNVNCINNADTFLTNVSINDIPVKALLDTGANCSIIKKSIARQLSCHLTTCSTLLDGIGSGKLHVSSKILVPVRFEDVCLELEMYVARDCDFQYDCIIGRNAVQFPDIKIVTDSSGSKLTRIPTSDQNCPIVCAVDLTTTVSNMSILTDKICHLDKDLQKQIHDIFQKYPSVLPSPDSISTVKTGELVIKLKDNQIVYYRPYRLAPIEREKVKEIIQELLDLEIIRESDSTYASPILLVKKKDGTDRMCVDFRALNKITEKERYPLPLIDDQIDKLGKAKCFISIDMKNGFHQIPCSADSIKYTAFITPDGHYEFLKMPFGICNGPSVFQKAINKAVQHLKFLLVYIDDLLIPFSTITEGLDYLDSTLHALSNAGFTINLKNVPFLQKASNIWVLLSLKTVFDPVKVRFRHWSIPQSLLRLSKSVNSWDWPVIFGNIFLNLPHVRLV